jgi:NADP-dependent aldehyde dehydrogenase
MITGKNYIGNLLSSTGQVTFKTFNPQSNTENSAEFIEASEVEINKAVALAHNAFESYSKKSGVNKSKFLNAIADEIEALDAVLIQCYCAESGLPEGRAKGERNRTLFQLRSFADLVAEGSWVEASIDTAQPDRKPVPKLDLRKMFMPLGPVVVFGASNFPLAYSTAGGDTAAALAAGCPVILKSHPMHAGTGELVASAIIKAAARTGMPNGVFSNLNSSGIEVGLQLVQHAQVKAVGFTGSIVGGRALFDLAAKRPEPIPVFAEMGSLNPVIILPKAIENKGTEWAKIYSSSISLGAGQFCTKPGLIFGMKSVFLNEFIEVLSEEINEIDPICMLHPGIHEKYNLHRETALQQQGLKSLATKNKNRLPNYASPSIAVVNGAEFLKNKILHHEVFGPFSIVVQCENKQELNAIVKGLEGQLTGTVLAEEKDASEFAETIENLKNRVGRIIFNGVPTGVEVCPSMVHGGPYPASTDSRFTAVGVKSIERWVRPFSYQNWPNSLLPKELKNENPLGILRSVDGRSTSDQI